MTEQTDSAKRTRRPQRTPLGTRNVLIAENRKGYVRRWINDVDDRLERAKDAGYSPVQKDVKTSDPRAGDSSQVGSIVSKNVGGGTRAILMEIPEKFYAEDQAAKQRVVDRTEEGLSRQKGVKGQQYGGVYGSVKVGRQGATKTLDASTGESDD